MSKTELKAALTGLQVNRPLKVAATAPAFRAPEPPKESQVQKEPEVRATTQVQPEPSIEKGTQDVAEPRVESDAQVQRSSHPRRATPQDQAVVEKESLGSKIATGFTRVPNRLLMAMIGGDLNKNEMRLLLLIARLTISFNRVHTPLSKSVVERYTGMQGRPALEAFAVLEERGLITKIPGSHMTPNQYGLAEGVGLPPSPDDSDPKDEKRPQVQNTPKAMTSTQVQNNTLGAKTSQGWGHFQPHKKDTLEIYKNSLSQQPEVIRRYFVQQMPSRKRESEWKAFQDLKADYSTEDIADGLALLQRRSIGTGTDAQLYHSPMAYLAKAIGEVLAEVGVQRQRAAQQEERSQREAEVLRQRQELESREAAQWMAQERAFNKTFPDEKSQLEAFEDLLRGTPFRAGTQAGRIFAIEKWWDGLTPHVRQELMA